MPQEMETLHGYLLWHLRGNTRCSNFLGQKSTYFFSYPQKSSFALMEKNAPDLPQGQEKEPDLRLLQQDAALCKISTAAHTYTDGDFAILLCFTLMQNCNLVLNCIGFCFK